MSDRTRRLANRRYNHLWHKVDQFFGQEGAKPPKLVPVKRGGGFAFTMESERRVYGGPKYRTQMASQKKGARNDGRFATLHEWGHIFGPNGSGETNNEGEANRAANIALRRLNKQQAKRRLLAQKR